MAPHLFCGSEFNLGVALGKQRIENKFCDITLKVGDECFPVHQAVLAAKYPWFFELFSCDDPEEKERRLDVIQQLDPRAMALLIGFAYTNSVEIDMENVKSLFRAAKSICQEDIQIACSTFIFESLNVENALAYDDFADEIECSELATKTLDFIVQHFVDIAKSSQIEQMSISFWFRLMDAPKLCSSPANETTFETMIRWIRYDQCSRASLLPQLLERLDLQCIRPLFLIERVANEPLIALLKGSRDLVDKSIRYHLLSLSKIEKNARKDEEVSARVYMFTADRGDLFYLDMVKNTVNKCPTSGLVRKEVCMAVIGDDIYGLGGIIDDEPTDIVNRYNVKSKSWSLVKPMNTKRMEFHVAVFDGMIYAIGGWDEANILCSVERYCPDTDSWSNVCDMLQPRSDHKSIVTESHIYVFPSENGETTIEKYDPVDNVWIRLGEPYSTCSGYNVATLNDVIYACIMSDNFEACLVEEHPDDNTSTDIATLKENRTHCVLVAYNEKLWAIGGKIFDTDITLSTTEVWDPKLKYWQIVEDIPPVPLSSSGALVILKHA